MIINGKEVKRTEQSAKKIQKKVNVIDNLIANDLKSDEIPKPDNNDPTPSIVGGFNVFGNEEKGYRNRQQRYEYFKEMAASEIINRGLEIISDDATQYNENGNIIEIITNDENIKNKLKDLYNRLDLNNELWSIIFETIKMGDNFYEIIVDDYKNPKKIIGINYIDPLKMERVEKENRLNYFQYKEVYLHEESGIKKEEKIHRFMPWQILHFKIESKDFKPYGMSVLNPAIKTFRRLSLLEDIMLTYRISRAPERRVFYIDVGNISTAEANRFIERVKNQYRSRPFIDDNGQINKQAHILSTTSDIFVPVREGTQGTRIETLQGGDALHNIDDMKHFQDKILRVMNIPPAYLGDQTDRSRGSLSQLDIKFSKYVERIQQQVLKCIYKISALELFFSKEKKDSLTNFVLELTRPSNIKEVTDIDLLNQKFNLISTIMSIDIFPKEWILKKIMKFSDKEITDIITFKNLAGEQQGEQQGGEGGPAGDIGGEFGGGQTPGGLETDTETPPEGETPEETPTETPAEGGEETPAQPTQEQTKQKKEIIEKAFINILGKDFLLENQSDFFKILSLLKNNNKKNKTKIIEETEKLFIKKTKENFNSNNIQSQIFLREFHGINFNRGVVALFEGSRVVKNVL